jgi:hypothetical protein
VQVWANYAQNYNKENRPLIRFVVCVVTRGVAAGPKAVIEFACVWIVIEPSALMDRMLYPGAPCLKHISAHPLSRVGAGFISPYSGWEVFNQYYGDFCTDAATRTCPIDRCRNVVRYERTFPVVLRCRSVAAS